jgi:hypothetical protein
MPSGAAQEIMQDCQVLYVCVCVCAPVSHQIPSYSVSTLLHTSLCALHSTTTNPIPSPQQHSPFCFWVSADVLPLQLVALPSILYNSKFQILQQIKSRVESSNEGRNREEGLTACRGGGAALDATQPSIIASCSIRSWPEAVLQIEHGDVACSSKGGGGAGGASGAAAGPGHLRALAVLRSHLPLLRF